MNIRAMMHKSLRLRFLLPSTCCLFLAFTGLSAFAAANDCVEEDPDNGRFICLALQPNPWGVSGCPNTADFLSIQRAGCEASGGTFHNPDCPGGHPATEEEIAALSVSFMQHLSGSSPFGAEDLRWSKSRTLGCPFGSTERTVSRNGVSVTACTIPVEPPCCKV